MESCQEEKDKCYFMYGHYKSNTNELFYIGIGKRRKGAFHSQIYARAYQCSSWSRNYLWLYYGLDRRNIGMAANMKRKTCGDYQFRYEYNKDLNLINLNSSLRKKAKPIICTNSNTGQVLKFSSSYKFAKFLGVSSNAHILDVLNNKRSNIKSWEVKYDL